MENKLFALLLAVVLLVAMAHFVSTPLQNQLDLPNATCKVFCLQTSVQHVDVGFGKIVQCGFDELNATLQQCKNVQGVSFTYDAASCDVDRLLQQLDVTVHTTQILPDLIVVCGYSPKIVGGIVLDGNKTNLQIAFDGTSITIGSPLILDDF